MNTINTIVVVFYIDASNMAVLVYRIDLGIVVCRIAACNGLRTTHVGSFIRERRAEQNLHPAAANSAAALDALATCTNSKD